MNATYLKLGIIVCGTVLFSMCGKKKEEEPKFANLALSVKSSTETSVDFGTLASGATDTTTFELKNSGDGDATDVAETGLAAPFKFLGGTFPGTGGTCAATLAAGATCELVVEYAPTATVYTKDTHEDTMLIEYKGGTKTSTEFALKGAGDNCSTQSAIAALTNSAGSSNLAWETGDGVMAQSFTPSAETKLTHINLSLYKGSTASFETVVLRVRAASSTNPGATDLATATVQGSVITTSAAEVPFLFSAPVTLAANTTYWFIIDPGVNSISNGTLSTYLYIKGAFSDNWSGGEFRIGTDAFASWNSWNYDLNFTMKSCAAL